MFKLCISRSQCQWKKLTERLNISPSLLLARYESEFASREDRIRETRNYKPYTWQERNDLYYPQIGDQSLRIKESLLRDTPLHEDDTQEKRYAEIYFG